MRGMGDKTQIEGQCCSDTNSCFLTWSIQSYDLINILLFLLIEKTEHLIWQYLGNGCRHGVGMQSVQMTGLSCVNEGGSGLFNLACVLCKMEL